MTSKTKILKGLKYFSQMFDEPKEEEIQIGLPTDVKHVAHIGWDGGPSTDAPSWMKDFKSAPLAAPPAPAEEQSDVQWVSEDTKTKKSQKAASSSKENSDSSEQPKAKAKDPSKPRHTRRHHSADSNDVTSRSLPADIPKKARRKKTKDADGTTRVRPRARASGTSNGGESGSETAPGLPPAGPKTSNDQSADNEKLE